MLENCYISYHLFMNFHNWGFIDDVCFQGSNLIIFYRWTSPQPRREEESYHFVANGFKISKSKRPSGDAFFISKLGLGVADGVGGWKNYGIDSSEFSEKLMDVWKNILILKEDELNEHEKELTDLYNEDKNEELESNDEALNSNYSDISKTFGVTIRKRKLKRARSSFHLNEKIIRACSSPSNQIKFEFNSPQSDSTWKDRQMIMKNINFEPRWILKEAYQKVDVYGSSTAWIATMHNQILKIANLGDSRWLLIRYSSLNHSSQVLLKTEEQQHSFNAPYQLANIPENLKDTKQGLKRDGKNVKFWKDKVSDSILYQCKVNEGDIVLCATDGLFDNLYIHEILQIIDSFMAESYEYKSFWSTDSMKTSSNTPEAVYKRSNTLNKNSAKRLAKRLVNEAHHKSWSHSWNTPFGEKFNNSNLKRDGEILRWKGGKPDDIWAVIGFVQCSNSFDI